MLQFTHPDGVFTPTVPDYYGDLSPAHCGLADDPNAEIDAAEAQRTEMLALASEHADGLEFVFEGPCECRLCGRTTGGSRIAGVDLQVCDDCLIDFVLTQIDSAKVRERMEVA
jgi:hypothetical protein